MDNIVIPKSNDFTLKAEGYIISNARLEGNTIHIDIEPKWISVRNELAPKSGKFLFYYHCGVGLGSWGQAYTTINGNSERTHKTYFLVLWPMDISENDGEPFQWNEDKMIEMNIYWMPLPLPPDLESE